MIDLHLERVLGNYPLPHNSKRLTVSYENFLKKLFESGERRNMKSDITTMFDEFQEWFDGLDDDDKDNFEVEADSFDYLMRTYKGLVVFANAVKTTDPSKFESKEKLINAVKSKLSGQPVYSVVVEKNGEFYIKEDDRYNDNEVPLSRTKWCQSSNVSALKQLMIQFVDVYCSMIDYHEKTVKRMTSTDVTKTWIVFSDTVTDCYLNVHKQHSYLIPG